MKRVISGAIALILLVGSAHAQQNGVSDRVIKAQPPQFQIALCPLKINDSNTKDGQSIYQKAFAEKDPAKRTAQFDQAKQKFLAGTAKGGVEAAPAWYYLGRLYLDLGDVAAADDAFTKAQAGLPACEDDIRRYREATWVALVNPATEMANAGQQDSALVLLNAANTIFRDRPEAYRTEAVIYNSKKQNDSTMVYLQKAIAASTDSQYVAEARTLSMFLGSLYLQAGKPKDAIAVYQGLLKTNPSDTEAKSALAVAYRDAQMPDSAEVLEKGLVESGQATTIDLMNMGVGFFNSKQYDKAADVFAKIVAKEPYNRDALFNLANAYYALKKPQEQLAAAERLVAIDPLNDQGQRVLAQAQQTLGKTDDAIKTVEAVEAQPIMIQIDGFAATAEGAKLQARAVGREPKDLEGKALPPVPVTLVFELIDASGTAVVTKEVAIPVLQPGATQPITVDGSGAAIVAWRYKKK